MPVTIAIQISCQDLSRCNIAWNVISEESEANELEARITCAIAEAVRGAAQKIAEYNSDQGGTFSSIETDPESGPIHEKIRIKLPKQ